MDQQIKDGLNACFGILKIANESVAKFKANTNSIFENLRAKGADDNSEFAVRIRDLADKTFNAYSDVFNRFEKEYKEIRGKFSETAEHLIPSVKKEETPVSRRKAAA
ncbi:phasin-related domain-containing protein [Leptospira kmetyi]|uniref:Chemotaxis protein n=1 Tax=Leptospira kmetyi TaxID=408139 RepID=A0A5F1XUI9_9LEPT|nr:hypothetical protein [Leptospira kmetyi]AYV56799.1 hypothetical protein EFP84_15715 [Leptospira kmetyi]PJZ31092.1 hypothetical protein CH378_03975 [Leptospira kmetyi]TGK18370.1 hypothetical protein EHO62_07985 [Leptospira kmetyi]TGK26751.1 hypothetical protein EHO66_18555 [Leptospira kmetyi]